MALLPAKTAVAVVSMFQKYASSSFSGDIDHLPSAENPLLAEWVP
jgi:hypothetical protein